MKRVKDFLYNWNDLVVILFILLAAAAIIYWRINSIMDYPSVLAAEIQKSAEESTTTQSITELVDDIAESTETSSEEPAEPGSGPKNNRLWTGGVLRSEVTVTTSEGSATEAAQALVDAGLFTSYEDFAAICEVNNLDPTDIKANTFTFPPGTSQSKIAEEVTKPMN